MSDVPTAIEGVDIVVLSSIVLVASRRTARTVSDRLGHPPAIALGQA
jgi:hypothetical protein